MKILMLSKDSSLLKQNARFIGDARLRHIGYSKALRQKYPDAEIRIITYSSRLSKLRSEKVAPGLLIFGTQSFHRIFFVFNLISSLFIVLKDGWKPDLITVQTPWEEGFVGLVISKIFNIPFLPQLHFDIFSDGWLAESFMNKWRRLIAKVIFKNASHIRVVSQHLAEKLSVNYKIPISKISIIPVGINFLPIIGSKDTYKRKLSSRLVGKKVVLFVGRLCATKNLKLFVKTAKEILESCPSAMFVIVGDGEEKDSTIEYIYEHRIEDSFLFLGTQLHADLPEIYAAADVFLLTSHYEGFPRVFVEASLSSVPIVTTACIGQNDLVKDAVSGYIVNDFSEKELSDKVCTLLFSEKQARNFGYRARKSAMKNFSLESLYLGLIDVWEITAKSSMN
jgi:phosphatidylinositol alpha-1,6-mannosyltransferase